jgi:26S proteasome regulatory subunit N8
VLLVLGPDNWKTVANSFGIPFEDENARWWFLDHNYIEGMYEMFNGEL